MHLSVSFAMSRRIKIAAYAHTKYMRRVEGDISSLEFISEIRGEVPNSSLKA